MQTKSQYRSDIDGLRAVAILGVVLFHLGVPWVPGGFVGVDIFFVISGYLISRIIFSETAEGKFSVVTFYGRRARRILPAFFFVSMVTAWAAYLLFYPSELVNFSESLLASTFFVGNIFFFATLNYFSPAADRLPLLHYWSLGVEEQFYLFFPVIVIGIRKYIPNALGGAVVVCLFASLLASGLLTHDHPTWTFYLLPFRAFELMIGSLLALPTTSVPRSDTLALAAATTGLCALATSIFIFRESMDFPGFAAAVPCVGAALVIWGRTNSNTLPSRILGSLPFRSVGKISYSLYLVHWPIIVFGTQLLPNLSPVIRIILFLGASLTAATFSFYFIEQPVRRNGFWTQRRIFACSLFAILVPTAISGDLISKQGYPDRFNAQVSHVLAFLQYDPTAPFRGGECFLGPDQGPGDFNQTLCLPTTGKKHAILWGDSAAADLYSGLKPLFKESDYSLGQATASSCPPIAGYDAPERPFCKAFNNFVLAKVLKEKPNILILSAGWPSDPKGQALLNVTLGELKSAGIETVIVGPEPYYDAPVPRILANRLLAGNHSTESDGAMLPLTVSADAIMKAIASKEHLRYISILGTVCSVGNCPMVTASGAPMEFDTIHLTTGGSKFVADRIAPLILKPVGSSG